MSLFDHFGLEYESVSLKLKTKDVHKWFFSHLLKEEKMRFQKEKFKNEPILLDGNEYFGCSFIRCELKFGASGDVTLGGCSFEQCKWSFVDAAARTIQFMMGLYHGTGEGGRKLIDETFKNIQHGSYS